MSDVTTNQPTALRMWRSVGNLDRVVLFTLAVLALVAFISRQQAVDSIIFTLESLWSIAPFLLASVLLAALSRACGWDQPIAAAFRQNQPVAIVLGALLGALSPFCSCGVIPIIAGLLRAGVPLAPVMAFWLASPLMDPEMFILMVGSLGFEFTMAKTVAAAVLGLFAGFTIFAFGRFGFVREPLREAATGCSSSCGTKQQDTRVVWTFWKEDARLDAFKRTSLDTGLFLLRWLTLAFLLESLMVAYIPADYVASWLGGESWTAIPVSAVTGIPTYLNGYAAIPLVRGLMDIGMLPGAALAFMIAGGVTSVPAAMAVFVTVNRRVFALYIALGFAGALLTGWTYGAYLAL